MWCVVLRLTAALLYTKTFGEVTVEKESQTYNERFSTNACSFATIHRSINFILYNQFNYISFAVVHFLHMCVCVHSNIGEAVCLVAS